jgi:hypothetical protein
MGTAVDAMLNIQARMGAIEARFSALEPAPATTPDTSADAVDETTFSSMLATATGGPANSRYSNTTGYSNVGGYPNVGGDPWSSGIGTSATGTTGASASALSPAQSTAWANDLLGALGMPRTTANIRAVTAWVAAEGTKAGNNPLATTQGMPGATSFNEVGVRNFASYSDGLAATVKTLHNGRYGNILSALAAGNDPVAVARAVADSPWGTGNGVLRRLGVAVPSAPADDADTYAETIATTATGLTSP